MLFGPILSRRHDRESRAITPSEAFAQGIDVSPSSASGVKVTPDTAAQMVTVHACTSLLSDSFAQLPAKSVIYSADGERSDAPTPSYLTEGGAGELTRHELVESVMLSLILADGNFYGEVMTRAGIPQEIRPLDPSRVTTRRDDSGRIVHDVEVDSGDTVTAADYLLGMNEGVFHVPGLRMPGSLVGVNPIERAKQAIGLGLVTEEHGSRLFSEGATPGGVIELPGPAEPEVVGRLKSGWSDNHKGTRKAHRPGVLSDGATWKPISVAPEQAQFLQTRGFQVEQICQLYRVPPHMVSYLSKSTSWGSGIEEQSIGYATFTLGGWISRAESRFSRLVPPGQHVRWNVNGLLRGAAATRFAAYATARQWGWLSVNDIRALENMDKIDGGDVYLSPLNMTPAEEALDD